MIHTTMQESRRNVTLFVAVACGLVAVACGLIAVCFLDFAIRRCCGVPPRDSTRATMWEVKRRILRYAHENGKLPTSLDGLPEIPAHGKKITDWWGNSIQFEVDSAGIVTLTSAGGRVWGYNPREAHPSYADFRRRSPPASGRTNWWISLRTENCEKVKTQTRSGARLTCRNSITVSFRACPRNAHSTTTPFLWGHAGENLVVGRIREGA